MIINNSIMRMFDLRKAQNNISGSGTENDIIKAAEKQIGLVGGNFDTVLELLEKTLSNTAEYNKSLISKSQTQKGFPSISSILGGLFPSSVSLSSGILSSFSEKAMGVILSFIGFDSKNLDLSGISQVDFIGYFAKIAKKSVPELMKSLTSTVLTDALNCQKDDLKNDLINTLCKNILGADLSSIDTNTVQTDGWTLDTMQTIINSKSIEEQQRILDSIVEQAPYFLNGEYKMDAEDPSSIPEDMKQTAKNCVAASIYDNVGTKGIMNQEPWEVIDTTDNPETGFFGRVYVNRETQEVVITNLGTSSAEDVVTDDVDMMQGKLPDQYEDALNHALKVLSDPQFSGYNITITGHSLGGSLTELVASTKEVREVAAANNINLSAISLNGYGISNIMNNQDSFVSKDGTTYHFVTEKESNQIPMYGFITEDDLVSCSTKHYGKTILFSNNNKMVPHMLNSMEEELNSVKPKSSKKSNSRFSGFVSPFKRMYTH